MKFVAALIAAMALCHVQAAPLVKPSLLKTLAKEGTADIMVIMNNPVEPVMAQFETLQFANSAVKTTAMVAELRKFTQASQQPVLDFLQQLKLNNNIQVKPFWITNRISVKGATEGVVKALLEKFPDTISEIRKAVVVYLEDTKPVPAEGPLALEWGVKTIQADQAWANGITGRGVVVSVIDTGVRATHESLVGGQRPGEYSWFDTSSVLAQSPEDKVGHGTHVTATAAGRFGTGVAQGSTWIHCRAFEGAQATEEALVACGQWITCPTKADGRDEDCSQKPQVVSNSWGGGNDDPFYNDIIYAWGQAKIIPVFAIGNNGPFCRSANSPGDQPNVISTGATNGQNLLTIFSSHGPSLWNTLIKPEVSAPGNNIRSASHFGDRLYIWMSGTSMACPHVAGAVALLLEKNPNASLKELSEALFKTTYRVEMPEIRCPGGGVNTTYPWPNNAHGWGNVRVNDALNSLNL